MRMPKQDLAALGTAFGTAFSAASSTALTGGAKLGAAAQDTGPAPATRRPPRRAASCRVRAAVRHVTGSRRRAARTETGRGWRCARVRPPTHRPACPPTY